MWSVGVQRLIHGYPRHAQYRRNLADPLLNFANPAFCAAPTSVPGAAKAGSQPIAETRIQIISDRHRLRRRRDVAYIAS